MRLRPPFRSLPFSITRSLLRHVYKFSTSTNKATQLGRNPEALLPSHLWQASLHQCKRFKTHNLFDEMPRIRAQASNTSKIIHAQSLKLGVGPVGSKGSLGTAIAKCGNVDFAEKAFNGLEKRDVLAWNSVLSLYSRRGWLEQIVKSFGLLRKRGVLPNEFTHAIKINIK